MQTIPCPTTPRKLRRWDDSGSIEECINSLKRCAKCILPETMPFIQFDADGVCNFCRSHKPTRYFGREALEASLAPYRRSASEPDCIVAFSGGRDSSYGLHYLVKEMGMKVIAYTYDWGMVTDIARRNQARICGKLGVEHILISADIRRKRKNIGLNVRAWLRRPRLGMIPLFMAGDKQYFYYAHQVRKRTGIDLVVLCGTALEKTHFKTGFCGIEEGASRIYNVSLGKKLRLAGYYAANFLASPRYLNPSLLDTGFAFFSSYLMKHDFLWLYQFVPWNEGLIDETLKREYGWEAANDLTETWRIGDGTAAFYNYIYYTVAGFSEHDTLLSNQIREGLISREAALERARSANRPRYDSIRQYVQQIGVDFDESMAAIQRIPKLYKRGSSDGRRGSA